MENPMSENKFDRRSFLTASAAGAASLAGAPRASAQKSANDDRIGVAMIGVGTRGSYLLEQAQECPNTEIRVICDLYDSNLKRAAKAAFNKNAQLTKEWEKALAAPGIDAVFIATPDFWHARMAVAAAQAGKHVYVEKALCRTLDEAKQIRKAVKENKVVLQLGHHQNSDPYFIKAREIFQTGQLGKDRLCRTYIDRTNPWPGVAVLHRATTSPKRLRMQPQTIDWERWIANAPKRPFDVQRFFRWRCWWDYGTGIAGDLMSHQWDGVNMIVGMGIPKSVQTMGGLYFWKQDREVPDQWHVMWSTRRSEMNVTFACTFHNRHHGTNTYILGRDASIEVDSSAAVSMERNGSRIIRISWLPRDRRPRRLASIRGSPTLSSSPITPGRRASSN